MMPFNCFVQLHSVAVRMVEAVQGPAVNQALAAAKNQLMQVFQQQFAADPNAALIWLNNLFTKELPQDYKNWYAQSQRNQSPQQQPAQQQTNQQNNQQNNQQTQQPANRPAQ
jgi:uncharacterized protein (DUF2225 family)